MARTYTFTQTRSSRTYTFTQNGVSETHVTTAIATSETHVIDRGSIATIAIPVVLSAVVTDQGGPSTFAITLDRAVVLGTDSVTPAFVFTGATNGAQPITAYTAIGTVVRGTIGGSFDYGELVTLAYTQNGTGIQTSAGGLLATFSGFPATNVTDNPDTVGILSELGEGILAEDGTDIEAEG